ncbi:MAG: DNA repair protein RadC [Bacilli bacterium]|nr:DNA repair protein RadC [Bacilli bacterium]
MKVRMKDIEKSNRPRERLISNGVESLSNEEILAIILKTGNKNNSAKELANILIKEFDGIKNFNMINYEKLKQINGIGPAKACELLASIELGKRISREKNKIVNMKINKTSLVFEYFKNILNDKQQEHFYCLYLDNSKRVIKDKLLFIGTINYSVVHPREIFKEAYMLSASSIICVHNHPTGNVLPSKQDLDLTNNLINIGNIMGIKVIDHVIIGQNNYYSFLENGDI